MGRRPEQTYFQKAHADGQYAHEKIPIVTNYKRNANQNHNNTSDLSEWLRLKIPQKNKQ